MKRNKKKSSAGFICLVLLLLLISVGMIGTGVYFIFFKNRDAYERQDMEKELADSYVEDLILQLTDPEAYEKKMKEEAAKKASRLAEAQKTASNKESGDNSGSEDETNPAEASGEDGTEPVSSGRDEGSSAGAPGDTDPARPSYDFSNLEYSDDNYYQRDGIIYTPDYARGRIDCVLEVPSAGIRRGVYTGTWEDINFDLDIWMVTAARPDYVLGETHYAIYGHNHTLQSLSFNRLQKDVEVGQYFYLTAPSGYYKYKVTGKYALTRENATRDLVNNFSQPSDKCFIITCGRDDGVLNYRYLDLIIEGTLEEKISLLEYARRRQENGS